MDIGALYGRTWQLFRNNPRLWLIAFLGALVGGSELGGGNSLNFPSNIGDTSGDPFSDFGDTFNSANVLPILLGVLICSIVLLVLFTILSMITRGGILLMTDALHAGEQPTVGACLRGGMRRAGALFLSLLVLGLPILLLSLLLVGIVIAVIAFIAGAGASSDLSEGNLLGIVLGGLACLLPLVLVTFLLGTVISVLGFFVGRLTVLDRLGPIAAVRAAWQLFRGNFGASLLTWVVLGLPGAVAGVALLIPSLIIVVPAVVFVISSDASAASVGVAVVAVIALIALSVAVSTFIGAFVSQGWTVFYRSVRARVAGGVGVGV